MTAQNQHYVPQFILRHFLHNEAKERVRVFDKHKDTIFTTSIKNIMAERRFNEFVFDEFLASFEDMCGRVEDVILPAYKEVVQSGKLANTPEQQAALALLITFQFIRTKAHRDRWKQVGDLIRGKTEAMGLKLEDIDGYEESNENNLKKRHLLSFQDGIRDFGPIISSKDFMLLKAPKGEAFYIGDNPVTLHNANDFSPYGNLGLAVTGIEIYLPLSSKLVLCAMCPSVAEKIRADWVRGEEEREKDIAKAIVSGKITISQAHIIRKSIEPLNDIAISKVECFESGGTLEVGKDQVDFINSLQAMYASRFVICRKGNFALARQHNNEFPKYRNGMQIRSS